MVVSRFLFQVPEQGGSFSEGISAESTDEIQDLETAEDEDGDLIVARQPSTVLFNEAITIGVYSYRIL